MKQYRKLLLEKCLGSLQGQVSSSATAEGMEALTKVLAELREGDIGSSFEAISKQCRAFFDNVSPDKSPPPHAISVCSVALRKSLLEGHKGHHGNATPSITSNAMTSKGATSKMPFVYDLGN